MFVNVINGFLPSVVSAVLALFFLSGCQLIVPMFFGKGEELLVPEPEVELLPRGQKVLPQDFPGIENNNKGRREVVPAERLQEE